VGVYFRGGLAVEQTWRERVAELEAQIMVAEAASRDANVKIETRVVKKTEYITRRGQDIVQFVDREVVKYDTTCVIPEPFVRAHNRAAEPVK
jgi:hypothetical protein